MDKLGRIRDEILDAIRPIGSERIPTAHAPGRYLAGPAIARRPAPPFTCSAMDGYAVRAAELGSEVTLRVSQALYAGDTPAAPLRPGEAARIFTGAPLPDGADTVVREEAARREGDLVHLAEAPKPGENVRRAGEDVLAGAPAMPAGIRLGPRQLALAIAVGAEEVVACERLKVTVLATGDEILAGRTPDSNGAAISGLLRALGAEATERVAGDDVGAIASALRAALDAGHAVVTIGGVSVGERDHVPAALERLGAEIRVHGVPMKPGKPFLFALAGEKPVFGLPGSPSACLVAYEVFARPAILKLAGAARVRRRALRLPLAEAVTGRAGRARFLWARLEEDGRVRPLGRDAAQVRGPALADALLLVPAGVANLGEGEPVETMLLLEDGPP